MESKLDFCNPLKGAVQDRPIFIKGLLKVSRVFHRPDSTLLVIFKLILFGYLQDSMVATEGTVETMAAATQEVEPAAAAAVAPTGGATNRHSSAALSLPTNPSILSPSITVSLFIC